MAKTMGPLERASLGAGLRQPAAGIAQADHEEAYEETTAYRGPAPPHHGALGVQLQSAQEQEKLLATVIRDLEQRLEPFMLPPDPRDETAKEPEPVMSPMAQMLRGHNQALEGMIAHLRGLVERLER